ncbi:MAG: phage portal protein [Magnetospirillum sp.]|nr:phage portal protein [Magnetospirillum sp.]
MGLLARIFGREKRASLPPRDPRLADWFGGANTSAGLRVSVKTAMQCPAVYAPIRLLAGTISIMPAELFRRLPEGGQDRADGLPLYDLVNARPNAWMTSAQFRRTLTEWMLGYGNAYARVVNPGAPTSLDPLHPQRVMPFRDSQNRVWYRVTPRQGPVATLASDEILHLRYGQIKDDMAEVEAESVIELHRETIGLAMAATEYLGRFFSNYAVPKGAIEVPGVLDDKAAKMLRESWERRHAGLENAHRLAILDGGMKFHEIGMTNKDAEFLGLYRHISSEIASKLFGIAPHLVGDTEKQTSYGTGVEQQNLALIAYTVGPIVQEWEEALNVTLLTDRTRRRYFFDFSEDGLLRGDFKSRMDGLQIAVQWGIMTPNEARTKLNLPRIDNGDSRLHPLNMVPAERVMDVLLKGAAAPADQNA